MQNYASRQDWIIIKLSGSGKRPKDKDLNEISHSERMLIAILKELGGSIVL